ncbi:nitrite reductase small subunit NirD [Jiulongibacter sediminis]|jgi:nitrite reductase (NADH) small subunit|uniref:nitrite reductase small subunit NirD n=1 Tax=Jiulongibacter sediminis TaxID=1605367 RepID=UPI0026EE5E73|nr:nitrite reductase small subunit NirD [Jiulongibacter sediminis]
MMTQVSERIKWILACQVEDVPDNGGSCALIEGEQIAIYNFARRGEWFATQNLCPHKKQMALSRGMIGSDGDVPKVACPFHKKTFSLVSGNCLSGDDYEIKTYPVKIENGLVYIGID